MNRPPGLNAAMDLEAGLGKVHSPNTFSTLGAELSRRVANDASMFEGLAAQRSLRTAQQDVAHASLKLAAGALTARGVLHEITSAKHQRTALQELREHQGLREAVTKPHPGMLPDPARMLVSSMSSMDRVLRRGSYVPIDDSDVSEDPPEEPDAAPTAAPHLRLVVVEASTPIIDMEAVGRALAPSAVGSIAMKHLQKALNFLRGHKPDLENCAKEAHSAVESLLLFHSGRTTGTTADAVRDLRRTNAINGLLLDSISKSFAYASSMPGVRHGIPTESALKREDAEVFLMASVTQLLALARFCT